MSNFSDYFREMESVGEEQRKSAILMALIASLDDQTSSKTTDIRKFAELFEPLFNAATSDTQRKTISALSRCSHVPGSIAEFISEQPLDLSAPFLSHSPALTDPILCYIIASKPQSYATLIAKRDDLSSRIVRALLAVNNPSVNRALKLRGYTKNLDMFENDMSDGQLTMANDGFDLAPKTITRAGVVEFFDDIYYDNDASQTANISEHTVQSAGIAKQADDNDLGYELFDEQWDMNKAAREAEESLRDTLRTLVSDISAPLDPEQMLRAKRPDDEHAHVASAIDLPILQGELAHRKHVSILRRHIENGHVEYLTTGLADALGTSYQLAERIMSDMSGRQLALTFTAIQLPSELCLLTLNRFFPHVSIMEGTEQGADALMQLVEHSESLEKLMLWVRADKMSNGDIDIELTDINVDYKAVSIEDIPYIAPVADNIDETDIEPAEKLSKHMANRR